MTQNDPILGRNLKPASPVQAEADALLKEFDRVLRSDVEGTLKKMLSEGKVVLNSDDLFKMLPRYDKNPEERLFLGPLLYPVARKFTDYVYKKLLEAPLGKDDTVVFTAGGSATGKSTILRAASGKPGVDFVVDTTFSDPVRAMAQVEKALASGRKVEIHYVYRDFSESVRAMLKRALDPQSGRIVPIDDMARTHYGAQRSVLTTLEDYQDNESVSIKLNELGTDGKLRTLDEKDFAGLLHGSVDKLQKSGQHVLDEFFRRYRARRRVIGKHQDPGRKNLYLSQDFYKAARSKAQTGGSPPRKSDA